ncbi:MAG: DUF2933 domain-containing protein [Actinomycetota bacterium]|jgi:hypothetical protein|nr:DUF2933 domain-containing protein [Actinomycetota bacterium]
MLKHCLNRKVIIGVAVVAVAVLAVDPHLFGRIFPLLLFAICPLSMLLMMRAMSGNRASGGMSGMSGCSSMSNGTATQAGVTSTPDHEVARLRAEVDQLRAERSSMSEEHRPALPVPGGTSNDPAIS